MNFYYEKITSYHLMNNIKHVQNRLKTMINENQDSQLQNEEKKIIRNNKKRNYCREEPRHLRKV